MFFRKYSIHTFGWYFYLFLCVAAPDRPVWDRFLVFFYVEHRTIYNIVSRLHLHCWCDWWFFCSSLHRFALACIILQIPVVITPLTNRWYCQTRRRRNFHPFFWRVRKRDKLSFSCDPRINQKCCWITFSAWTSQWTGTHWSLSNEFICEKDWIFDEILTMCKFG